MLGIQLGAVGPWEVRAGAATPVLALDDAHPSWAWRHAAGRPSSGLAPVVWMRHEKIGIGNVRACAWFSTASACMY